MTGFARAVAALLGLTVLGSAFLPWVGDLDAWHLHIRSLLSPGEAAGGGYVTSIGTAIALAAALILLGAVIDGRGLVIIGALIAVAVPAVWILSNAISHAEGAVPMARVQIGAFAAAVGGFMTLILAAVARDTSTPTLR